MFMCVHEHNPQVEAIWRDYNEAHDKPNMNKKVLHFLFTADNKFNCLWDASKDEEKTKRWGRKRGEKVSEGERQTSKTIIQVFTETINKTIEQ